MPGRLSAPRFVRLSRGATFAFIDALESDADWDLALDVAIAAPTDELDAKQWLGLGGSREAGHPPDALAVYQAMAEEVLQRPFVAPLRCAEM